MDYVNVHGAESIALLQNWHQDVSAEGPAAASILTLELQI